MNGKFADILDAALVQASTSRPLDQILETYSVQKEQLRPLLETALALDSIRPVELPEQLDLEADRRAFLQGIAHLEIDPVSPSLLERINRWITAVIPLYSIKQLFQIKEKRNMSAMLANIILIISILIASAGGTVALANDSLPDSPLYPVKLAVEQIQTGLLADPGKIAPRHLLLAQNRSREILRLAQGGEIPQESTALRLQEHYNLALQYAAQLGEAEMLGVLTQAQHMIQEQLQEMSQVRSQFQWQYQDPLGETIRVLQQIRARVQEGLDDPAAFRLQVRFGFEEAGGNPDCPSSDCLGDGEQYRYGLQPEVPGPGAPGGNPDCPSSDCLGDGEQYRYGLQPEAPGPGAPAGNPECPSNDCVPSGDANRYGPSPEESGPGEPAGNPECPSGDCVPAGGANQYGTQPEESSPGEPGGNPDCPQADCEPVGDENQNGQPSDTSGSSQDGTGGGSDPSSGQGGQGGP
jgi:hypothetical protein